MSHYTVGELANHLGVTVRTLQYYDRKGLLTAERASESNRRYYNDAHIQQLQLIFLLKQFGCTLMKLKRYYTKIAICRRLKQCCNCIRKN